MTHSAVIVLIKFICSRCEGLKMNPLFKTALLRTSGFLCWTFFSAWLFVMVENTGKDHKKEKYQLLLSLYNSMATKYNMTIEEFNNFSSVAYDALSDPGPQWTFFVALQFVIHTLTTIGKVKMRNHFKNLLLLLSSNS